MLFVFVCLLIVGAYAVYIISRPVMRSEEVIRERILRLTPIGMHMDDVIEIVTEKVDRGTWLSMGVGHTHGFVDYGKPHLPIIGVQGVTVKMGRLFSGNIAVRLAWGFDSEGYLIDIYVRKMYSFST